MAQVRTELGEEEWAGKEAESLAVRSKRQGREGRGSGTLCGPPETANVVQRVIKNKGPGANGKVTIFYPMLPEAILARNGGCMSCSTVVDARG